MKIEFKGLGNGYQVLENGNVVGRIEKDIVGWYVFINHVGSVPTDNLDEAKDEAASLIRLGAPS